MDGQSTPAASERQEYRVEWIWLESEPHQFETSAMLTADEAVHLREVLEQFADWDRRIARTGVWQPPLGAMHHAMGGVIAEIADALGNDYEDENGREFLRRIKSRMERFDGEAAFCDFQQRLADDAGSSGTFMFKVPVVVTIEKGAVKAVKVDDTAPLAHAQHLSGASLSALKAAAHNSDWPAWNIGYL